MLNDAQEAQPTSRRALLSGMIAAAAFAARPTSLFAQEANDDARLAKELQAVAAAGGGAGQPQRLLAELDRALAATVGHKLFTVLVLNHEKGENQRYYSNQPAAYPTGGSKPIVKSGDFYKMIVEAGEPRICYNYEDMKRAFFDHELIRSLGCESAVNYPVRWNGRTIGTLNLLHQAGWYNERDLPKLETFATLTIPAMMEIVKRWG